MKNRHHVNWLRTAAVLVLSSPMLHCRCTHTWRSLQGNPELPFNGTFRSAMKDRQVHINMMTDVCTHFWYGSHTWRFQPLPYTIDIQTHTHTHTHPNMHANHAFVTVMEMKCMNQDNNCNNRLVIRSLQQEDVTSGGNFPPESLGRTSTLQASLVVSEMVEP